MKELLRSKAPSLFRLLKGLKYIFGRTKNLLESGLQLALTCFLSARFAKLPPAPERSKPHLLLLTDFNLPPGYEQDSAYELWALSLMEADLASFTRMTLTKGISNKLKFIRDLYETCKTEKPDLILLALGGDPDIFPAAKTWRKICQNLPSPLLVLLADSLPHSISYLERIPEICAVISIDSAAPCQNSSLLAAKSSFLPSPICTRIFFPQNGPRLQQVAFMGLRNHHYRYRAEILDKLEKSGVPVYKGGGYDARVSLENMAEIYRNSLFVVNFSGKNDRIIQCKGRVMEATLCGACLIEYDNPETNKWLRPNIDYVPYSDIEEIPEIVRNLLRKPDKIEKIRLSGMRQAQKKFGAEKTWRQILDFSKRPPMEKTAFP